MYSFNTFIYVCIVDNINVLVLYCCPFFTYFILPCYHHQHYFFFSFMLYLYILKAFAICASGYDDYIVIFSNPFIIPAKCVCVVTTYATNIRSLNSIKRMNTYFFAILTLTLYSKFVYNVLRSGIFARGMHVS